MKQPLDIEKLQVLYCRRRENFAAPAVELPKSGSTVKRPVIFSGTGEPGWAVIVYQVPIDGSDFLVAIVDDNGKWSGESEKHLAAGHYSAFALQTYNHEISPWSPIFDFNVED